MSDENSHSGIFLTVLSNKVVSCQICRDVLLVLNKTIGIHVPKV